MLEALLLLFILVLLMLVWVSTRSRTQQPLWPKILRSKQELFKKTPPRPRKGEFSDFHPLVKTHLSTPPADTSSKLHDEGSFLEEGAAFSHLENCVKKIERQFFPKHQEKASPLLGDTLIDRRLFADQFRSETEAFVMFYHIGEKRVIFVSTNVKRLLGYSPQDFRIRFHEIIYDLAAWKKNLYQLTWRKRLYTPVAFRDLREKSASNLCAWDCYSAEIRRENSEQYCVSLFYPAYCYLPRADIFKES